LLSPVCFGACRYACNVVHYQQQRGRDPTAAAQVGGLTGGRVLIAQGAVDGAKVALAIAIRYACMRPQFEDKLIIAYLTHQRRLLPGLATTYALQLALLRIKVGCPPGDRLVHFLNVAELKGNMG